MKAGFGNSDITPRPGVQLAGYGPYRNRAARKITAPLSARALVVQAGRRRHVLLNLELCVVPVALAQRIREVTARRIGCRPDDVMVTVTHTHSAPAVGGMLGWGMEDAVYVETLPARTAAAAEQAVKNLGVVEWRHGEVPCEGIAINRETDAGFWVTDSVAARLAPDWRPARPEETDPVLRVLTAHAGGRLVGVLHHFACHAVVGSEQTFDVHGDFVGLACRAIERSYPGATAIFLPGAMGDINPAVVHRGPAETRRALRVLTAKYTAALRRGLRAARPVAVDNAKSVRRDVTFSRRRINREKLRRRVRELETFFARPGLTDDTKAGRPPLHTHGMHMVRLEGARAVLAGFKGNSPPNPPVNVQGLRLGPVALLGVGLEVFHSLQAPVLKRSPHRHTWVVSLVAGAGYAPDARAFAKAGYTDDLVPSILGELPYTGIYAELPRCLANLAGELE